MEDSLCQQKQLFNGNPTASLLVGLVAPRVAAEYDVPSSISMIGNPLGITISPSQTQQKPLSVFICNSLAPLTLVNKV